MSEDTLSYRIMRALVDTSFAFISQSEARDDLSAFITLIQGTGLGWFLGELNSPTLRALELQEDNRV